jgi:glutamate-1-semialdehyde 2,1-aminomutase
MSFANNDEDVERLLGAYGEVLPLLSSAVDHGDVRQHLRCEPLKPLFRVR